MAAGRRYVFNAHGSRKPSICGHPVVTGAAGSNPLHLLLDDRGALGRAGLPGRHWRGRADPRVTGKPSASNWRWPGPRLLCTAPGGLPVPLGAGPTPRGSHPGISTQRGALIVQSRVPPYPDPGSVGPPPLLECRRPSNDNRLHLESSSAARRQDYGHPAADGQKTTVRRNSFKSLCLGLSLGRLIVLVEGRVGSISRTLRRYSGLSVGNCPSATARPRCAVPR